MTEKLTLLPFHPAGAKAWVAFEKPKPRDEVFMLDPKHRACPGQRGAGEKFRFWLYSEYSAEVVRVNKKAMLRFTSQGDAMLFALKWL